jgi:hypothetical protein
MSEKTETLEPGVWYKFDEPFASAIERNLVDMKDAANAPKINPARNRSDKRGFVLNDHVKKKMAAQPPSPAQLAALKKLGAKSMPMNKLDASRMIDELKNAKRRT